MATSEKDKKLEELDTKLLDAMIDIMDKGKKNPEEYDALSSLATVSNYLAKNNKTAEKKKSTVEDDIKKRQAEAKKRREERELEDDDEF